MIDVTMDNESPLKWSIISDVNKLALFSEEWDLLNNVVAHSSLFNSPYWLLNWTEQYWQSEWQLYLVTARCDGKLVVLAPFYIQPAKTIWGIKKLYPLGQGEPECSEISSEYNDILILPEFSDQALTELAKILKTINVDQIIWRAILLDSHINTLLLNAYNYSQMVEGTRYVVDGSNWSAENLSKNMRSRYRRGLNQLNKIDGKISWVKQGDFDHYWQLMKDFHQQRWLGKNKKGAFCSDEFNKSHAKFRDKSPENVAMSAIWVNDEPIAIHYYFSDSTTLYFYQSGWNEGGYSHLSPGLILHLWSIRNNNKRYYDFMMGGINDSYKKKFGCEQTPMTNIKINSNPKKVFLNKVLNKIF
ncbi:GNAT family N-acetyltransferase [Colwellia demingiae]|uniref:GNAT family N-acetyltransferase n=2 Tax=Colwellia demingiae TaxID=89401 RepID=A0A5C6QPE3_9GAMM|nr:GNAT family N-acetyltransferase [Colwellia demingiae]